MKLLNQILAVGVVRRTKPIRCFILGALLVNSLHGEIVYHNDFDNPSDIGDFSFFGGDAPFIGSGQLLAAVGMNFGTSMATLNTDVVFSDSYKSTLDQNSGLITWSFNVSNQDMVVNNNYIIVLSSTDEDTFSISAGGYYIRGGGLAGNRMGLWRFDFGLGGGQEPLIDITDGLAPLPEKGSFKITFEPLTNVWSLYGTTGPEYVDPRVVDTLLGTSVDGLYTSMTTPFMGLGAKNGGTAFHDNLTVSITEPATSVPTLSEWGIIILIIGVAATVYGRQTLARRFPR